MGAEATDPLRLTNHTFLDYTNFHSQTSELMQEMVHPSQECIDSSHDRLAEAPRSRSRSPFGVINVADVDSPSLLLPINVDDSLVAPPSPPMTPVNSPSASIAVTPLSCESRAGSIASVATTMCSSMSTHSFTDEDIEVEDPSMF